MITRRNLLAGCLAACAAPAFVRNPMKIAVVERKIIVPRIVIAGAPAVAELEACDHQSDAMLYAVAGSRTSLIGANGDFPTIAAWFQAIPAILK